MRTARFHVKNAYLQQNANQVSGLGEGGTCPITHDYALVQWCELQHSYVFYAFSIACAIGTPLKTSLKSLHRCVKRSWRKFHCFRGHESKVGCKKVLTKNAYTKSVLNAQLTHLNKNRASSWWMVGLHRACILMVCGLLQHCFLRK